MIASVSRQFASLTLRTKVTLAFEIITLIALYRLKQRLNPRYGETYRELAGRVLRQIPSVDRAFHNEITGEFKKFCEKTKKHWEVFGEPVVEIPEKGLPVKELIKKIDHFAALTNNPLQRCEFSGTIYPNELRESQSTEMDLREEKLSTVFAHAFSRAYLWNPLHESEFGIGYFLQYQVVQMVSHLFGGDSKQVAGFVTSGGTESLMLAMRVYRNFGMEVKGLQLGEAVIIAPDTVHAAVMKAAESFHIKLELIPCDDHGVVDLQKMQDAIIAHKKTLVALVGSAPSYRTGVIDPIYSMANWAKSLGVGLHVDCCLGGFIVNELGPENRFLKLDGVTSLSCDTHKNGGAPKGSSVLAMKMLGNKHLTTYAAFAIPNWSGGVYGTEREPGSQSALPAFFAYLALLGTGKQEYRETALAIQEKTQLLAKKIKEVFPDRVELLGKDERINVVAFRVRGKKWGATYALSEKMKERHFILNEVSGDAAHFCVTKRFCSVDDNCDRFIQAMQESLREVDAMTDYPSNASLYGTIEASFKPSFSEKDYLKNMFFGVSGLKEGVKAYFKALLNPNLEF